MRLALLLAVGGILFSLSSCQDHLPAGTHELILTDSIINAYRSNYQIYYVVADTARWEATIAAADTIDIEDNRWKLRSNKIWYEARMEKGELRASQHYPGWERRIDSVSRQLNILRMLDNNRVKAEIPAIDVTIGKDSFRLGIIRVMGKAFDWQEFNVEHPDYLLITTYGNQYIPIVMDQANIGPISRKTVFRVGRRYFVLKSVAEDRRRVIIEETELGREFPLAAELDLYYKQIPVRAMDSTMTTIKRTPGRDLAVYFGSIGHLGKDRLLRLDSLYSALPKEERAGMDLAIVLRNTLFKSAERFVEETDFQLPLYLGTEKTCLRLNCHPSFNYFVGVSEQGRISTFYGYHSWLEERLGVEPPAIVK